MIPGLGRSPGGENSYPLLYSCLENPMDRGAWQATVHGVAKSQTGLSNFHFHHLLLSWYPQICSLHLCFYFWAKPYSKIFFFNVYFSCFLLAFLWFFPLYFYHLELILAYGDYFSDASLLIPTFIEWPTLIDFLNGLPYFQGCFFFCIWLRNNLLKLKWRK